ncbi:MAG: hypothetical protein WBD27_14030 [Pyrinomonadaceae bacterium]
MAKEEATKEVFELPEYFRATSMFTYKAIQELTRRKDPFLSQIPVVEVDEIPTAKYSLPSGEILEQEPIQTTGTAILETDDLLSGELNSYYVFIDALAESLLPQLKKQFYEHLDSVCDAFGQSVNANGQPLSHELMMQVVDKKQWEFDEDGNFAEGEMMVLGESMAEQLRNLPPMTNEQKRAWDDLLARKRQEFDDRKRTRKLS